MKIILKSAGHINILSLASDKRDIVIDLGDVYAYAVLLPSYYEAEPVYCKTEKQAVAAYKKLYKEGYNNVTIIDRGVETYIANDGGELESTDKLDHVEIV